MPLPHDEFLKLPIIALTGLAGNMPDDYNTMQLFLLPYLDMLQLMWWLCFLLTLTGLFTWYIVLPNFRRDHSQPNSTPPFLAPVTAIDCNKDHRYKTIYSNLFSLSEIQNDVALRLFGGTILLGYLAEWSTRQKDFQSTIEGLGLGKTACWSFFQNCTDIMWMHTSPFGYSQNIVFMAFFGIIIIAAHSLLKQRILLAHACMLLLFAFKIYLSLLSMWYNGNFDYYINLFNLVFLFLPNKRFFGSLIIVWSYFLSTAAKIHPGWVWGAYFSSLKLGLPLTPRGYEPLFTNFIIFMEMIMSWFLFSRRRWLQKSVFVFFCFFHIYSGIFVGYLYPTIVLPPLLIFFGTLYQPFATIPQSKNSIAGWAMILALLILQIYNHLLPSDPKLTLEGNYFGFYMFEANHQCRETYTDENGKPILQVDNTNAYYRCDPWISLQSTKPRLCSADVHQKIHFTFIHSINGGPFYKIIDEPDLCGLHYTPLGRNGWIKNESTAPIVGRPLENYYR